MPSNTTNGLPYPLPTEPVKDGAVSIQNLANALDTRGNGYYTQRGSTTWTVPAGGVFMFVYPLKFAGTPIVCKFVGRGNGTYQPLITVNSGYPFSYQCQVMVHSLLKASPFTLAAWSGALTVDWEITGPGPLTVYP